MNHVWLCQTKSAFGGRSLVGDEGLTTLCYAELRQLKFASIINPISLATF